jgi:hypothetical protein
MGTMQGEIVVGGEGLYPAPADQGAKNA